MFVGLSTQREFVRQWFAPRLGYVRSLDYLWHMYLVECNLLKEAQTRQFFSVFSTNRMQPGSGELAFFVLINKWAMMTDMTDHFTPCTCMWGYDLQFTTA